MYSWASHALNALEQPVMFDFLTDNYYVSAKRKQGQPLSH